MGKNNTGIEIGLRFREKESRDMATVIDIFVAYPDGVATLFIEVKFDVEDDTLVFGLDGFQDYYEFIK